MKHHHRTSPSCYRLFLSSKSSSRLDIDCCNRHTMHQAAALSILLCLVILSTAHADNGYTVGRCGLLLVCSTQLLLSAVAPNRLVDHRAAPHRLLPLTTCLVLSFSVGCAALIIHRATFYTGRAGPLAQQRLTWSAHSCMQWGHLQAQLLLLQTCQQSRSSCWQHEPAAQWTMCWPVC